MLDTHRTLDTSFLEDLLKDDCKCESIHNNLPCTSKVVGLVTGCSKSVLKCENGILYSKIFMDRGGKCIRCNNPASECWTIRPI